MLFFFFDEIVSCRISQFLNIGDKFKTLLVQEFPGSPVVLAGELRSHKLSDSVKKQTKSPVGTI